MVNHRKKSHSYKGEILEWNGSGLRFGENSLDRKSVAKSTASANTKDLFEFLEAFCELESRILKHAEYVMNYKFELFEGVSVRDPKNAILEF